MKTSPNIECTSRHWAKVLTRQIINSPSMNEKSEKIHIPQCPERLCVLSELIVQTSISTNMFTNIQTHSAI